MSTFIKLSALTRNGKPYIKEILVDVNKIMVPVIQNISNQSIIEVDEDNSYSDDYFSNISKYTVSQTLAAIDALTNEVFIGTVVTQNGRPPLTVSQLFIKSKVVDTISNDSIVSSFQYKVMSMKSPEKYTVTQSLNTINA